MLVRVALHGFTEADRRALACMLRDKTRNRNPGLPDCTQIVRCRPYSCRQRFAAGAGKPRRQGPAGAHSVFGRTPARGRRVPRQPPDKSRTLASRVGHARCQSAHLKASSGDHASSRPQRRSERSRSARALGCRSRSVGRIACRARRAGSGPARGRPRSLVRDPRTLRFLCVSRAHQRSSALAAAESTVSGRFPEHVAGRRRRRRWIRTVSVGQGRANDRRADCGAVHRFQQCAALGTSLGRACRQRRVPGQTACAGRRCRLTRGFRCEYALRRSALVICTPLRIEESVYQCELSYLPSLPITT